MIKNNELLLEICKISLLAGYEILQIYNDKIEVVQKKGSLSINESRYCF